MPRGKYGQYREFPWGHVDQSAGPQGCWPWTHGCDNHGYGQLWLRGRMTKAHRAAYEATHGNMPALVMHTCDNPPCCNPAHLLAATQAENLEDMRRKGRAAPTVLTMEQAREIRALRGQLSQRAIAARYGVAPNTVRRIHKNEIWREDAGHR